jgi:TIGR02436 family protein
MEEKTVKYKSYAFALRIIKAYKFLSSEQREFVLSKQLLRSGTAIGALIREAEHAESKADFIHKLSVSLKEANETEYWLMLLHDSDLLGEKAFQSILADCQELIKMLISIIKTLKENNKKH